MSAAYQDLYLEQGANFSTTITMTDVYGNAYNLASFNAVSLFKQSYATTNVIGMFTTTLNTGNGSMTLAMDGNTSSNIAPQRYVYDAYLIDNVHNNRIRILEGILTVSASVSFGG